MLIRHLGSRIRQSPCGELVFTNGSLFIRGALRIRQVHIYLDRYTCFARYTFSLDSMIHARVRVKTRRQATGRIRSCHALLHDDLRNLKSVFNETITSRIKLSIRSKCERSLYASISRQEKVLRCKSTTAQPYTH